MKRILISILILTMILIPTGEIMNVLAIENQEINPRIIIDDNSFDNVIVADIVITDAPYNADKSGKADCTQIVKQAISKLAAAGGGTIYFPKGFYRLTSSVTIDNYVTLMGEYVNPDTNSGDYGTVIIADVQSTVEDLPALFRLRGSTGVVGMTVYYPKQIIGDIKPFPYVFEIMGGANSILEHMQFTIQNVTLLNAYKGIAASRTINPNVEIGTQDAHEGLIVDNLKGTVLKCGINSVNESDIGYFKNIDFSPKYWAQAEGFNNPTMQKIVDFTQANSVGLMLGDLEWSPYYNINIEGYKTGVHIIKGTRIQENNPIAFMGGFNKLNITNCEYGLVVDQLYKGWGMLVSSGKIEGNQIAVINNSQVGYVRLTDVQIAGKIAGERVFSNAAAVPAVATQTPSIVKPKPVLYDVVKSFGANNGGYVDCTSQIQSALNAAASDGGGIVYLRAGFYKVTAPLVVGEGVQLRGCMPITNRGNVGKSKGTIIFSYYDSDSATAQTDTAFITLNKNAGVSGLRICYPDNNLWKDTETTYQINRIPYTIRAVADNAYCTNIGLVNSFNGIDMSNTRNCVIKNVPSLFFNNGILLNNAQNCHIENVFSNATIATQSGLHTQFPDLFTKGWLWRVTSLWNYYTYTETHTQMITMSNSSDINIMSMFTFCSAGIVKATDSAFTMNGCGADRMYENGIVLDLTNSDATVVNQLKYNCMMFNMSGASKLSIYGRMNLILGDGAAINDVEYNIVKNKIIKDLLLNETASKKVITYPIDIEWKENVKSKNPLNDILNEL